MTKSITAIAADWLTTFDEGDLPGDVVEATKPARTSSAPSPTLRSSRFSAMTSVSGDIASG